MAEVTTTKQVNLYQLGQELGGNPSFRMSDNGTQRTVRTADVSQSALQAAVTAHVANPAIVAPPSTAEVQEQVRQTNRADLDAKLALLISEAAAATALLQAQRDTANLATGTLTTAVLSNAARQLQAAVKEQAMLQQAHMKRTVAIARLVSGALDSTGST